jgi:hypothetical protein
MVTVGVCGGEGCSGCIGPGIAIGGEEGLGILEPFCRVSSIESRYRSPCIKLIESAGSGSLSSSSEVFGLLLVISQTPRNVKAQPDTNFIAWSVLVRSKSRYKTALPKITDSVKSTNCVGITWVASNRCSARLIYLICMTAVKTNTKIRR